MTKEGNNEGKKNRVFGHPLTFVTGFCMVATLLGYVFGPQHDFSDVENRYLQLRPGLTAASVADGSFMRTFETYTDEQIPFRSSLIKVKTAVDTVLLKIENHGIVRGKDGYLFDKTTDDLTQFNQNLAIIDKFIKNSDKKILVAFAPTSTLINGDKLPTGVPVLDEKMMNENASLILSVNPNAEFVNIYDELMSHRDEELYYKTDHHWKSIGAYYGYRAISEKAGVAPVDIRNLSLNEADDFYGTFYAKYQAPGTEGDCIEYINVPGLSYTTDDGEYDSIYDDEKLKIYDKYAMFMRGNFGRATVNIPDNNSGRELVIFKDSYANCLIPFLCYNYDTIEIADLRYMGSAVSEFLDEHKNADVLMLYNYSFLNDDKHFFKLLK